MSKKREPRHRKPPDIPLDDPAVIDAVNALVGAHFEAARKEHDRQKWSSDADRCDRRARTKKRPQADPLTTTIGDHRWLTFAHYLAASVPPGALFPGMARTLRGIARRARNRPADDVAVVYFTHLAVVWREWYGKLPGPRSDPFPDFALDAAREHLPGLLSDLQNLYGKERDALIEKIVNPLTPYRARRVLERMRSVQRDGRNSTRHGKTANAPTF